MGDYGRAFSLWREATPQWQDFVGHAFVRGLGDGTLPRPAFLHYLKQDYLFLLQFTRAWGLAIAKAETLEEMRYAAATAHLLIRDEIELHITTCAAEGIDRKALDAVPEHPANMAYTRYVIATAVTGDYCDLLAALAPCVLGYGEIGAVLKERADSDVYQDWIDVYSSREFQDGCRKTGALIDAALTRRLGSEFETSPRWPALLDHFDRATCLEVGFWDMGFSPPD